MNDNYSKRELDYHFNEIKGTLNDIKQQVVKTNGRVNSLEKWRYIVTGGIVVLAAISAPNVGAIVKAFTGN